MNKNIAAGPERLLFPLTWPPLEYVVLFHLSQQKREIAIWGDTSGGPTRWLGSWSTSHKRRNKGNWVCLAWRGSRRLKGNYEEDRPLPEMHRKRSRGNGHSAAAKETAVTG